MAARKKTANASTALDGLENLVTGQGGTKDSRYHGARTFRFRRRHNRELIDTYQSNWLAGQVVDIPAFEMTRERREINLDDPKKVELIELEEKRLGIWERVKECLQWSDLLGGGGLLLGVDGAGDWKEPLYPERVGKGALKWVHAVDASALVPMAGKDTHLVIDPTSPAFMQPEFYQVVGSSLVDVHYTRIVRFQGLALPWVDMQRTLWWGGSRITRAFDAIADAEQVIGGVSDLITESKIDVYGIKDLMALLSTPDGEERVKKRIALADLMKSIYNGIIIDAQETYEQKQSQLVQGMSNIIETYLNIVAAASGIPVTRLLGTSARGLNATGEGDIRNFYDMIDARRETYLRPRIDELDQVLLRSALDEIPKDFSWTFGPLWQMDDSEIADVEQKRAQRDQIYLNAGVVDEVVVAKQLKQDRTYGAIDDPYIAELETAIESREDEPDDDPNTANPNPREPGE